MISNYFILCRIIKELNDKLTGYRILSAFSQEKEKALLECRHAEDELFIEISVGQNFPYIALRQKYTRAKKNVFAFFHDAFPSEIRDVSIALFERVIRIKLAGGELYFVIRGNKTNLYFSGETSTGSFLKVDQDEITSAISGFRNQKYISEFPSLSFAESDSFKDITSKHPYISRDIINEAKTRDAENPAAALNSVIKDLGIKPPVVYYDENNLKLAVEGFLLFGELDSKLFADFITAENYFITKKYSGEYFTRQKKTLLSKYENELGKLASKINSLRGRIEAGSKEAEYKKLGELLLINISRIQKGKNEITVEDIYNNYEPLSIKIDPSLPPRKNTDRYFEKARDEKLGYEKSVVMYKEAVKKYGELQKKAAEIKAAEEMGEIKNMQDKKDQKEDKDDIRNKFRRYIIDGKYSLYIGRDSRKNDLLTMKFAKQNDYWFHARGVPGSHAVLRVDNAKEPVPKPVLKKAAAIAAFHSKAKNASLAPVSYTLKKYVTKKKGMEPGKVNLLREDVLLVKPEIPAGCDYISAE